MPPRTWRQCFHSPVHAATTPHVLPTQCRRGLRPFRFQRETPSSTRRPRAISALRPSCIIHYRSIPWGLETTGRIPSTPSNSPPPFSWSIPAPNIMRAGTLPHSSVLPSDSDHLIRPLAPMPPRSACTTLPLHHCCTTQPTEPSHRAETRVSRQTGVSGCLHPSVRALDEELPRGTRTLYLLQEWLSSPPMSAGVSRNGPRCANMLRAAD